MGLKTDDAGEFGAVEISRSTVALFSAARVHMDAGIGTDATKRMISFL
jgi:hypothetical protein